METEDEIRYGIKLNGKHTKEAIFDNFDSRKRDAMIRAVKNAYKWVDLWVKDPNNKVLVSHGKEKYVRGFVVGIAVEYFLIKEIADGNLDLICYKKKNRNKSYDYHAFSDNEATFELTVNQTQRKSATAPKACNRDERIDGYQSSLFQMDEEPQNTKDYYQLTHGYQTAEPAYVILGIPQKGGKWKDFVDILQLPQITNKPKLKTKVLNYKGLNLADMQNYIKDAVKDE